MAGRWSSLKYACAVVAISVVPAPGATGAMAVPIVAVTAVVTAAEVMAEGAVVVAAEEGIEESVGSLQSAVESQE